MQDFMGKNGFVWFFGVVEDVNDPEYLGRCRVRCFGIHTERLNELPTEDLPWAHPMQPITSAASSGVGTSPTGILPGTHVVGFFRDGELAQQPVIMGTVGGIPQEEADRFRGFNDPSGQIPRQDHIGKPDTDKLAYGDIEGTIVPEKINRARSNSNHPTPVTYSKDDRNWSEPETPYGATYPFNHVKKTVSGHIEEYDDTPSKERIHKYHKSGTFEEIHPDGTVVTNVVNDNYHIVAGKDFVHIDGASNVMIGPIDGSNASRGHSTVYITGDSDVEIGGNMYATVNKNAHINVKEKASLNANDKIAINANKGINIQNGDNFRLVSSNGETTIWSKDRLNLLSEGNILIQSDQIDINP